jgi:hypothetical protein
LIYIPIFALRKNKAICPNVAKITLLRPGRRALGRQGAAARAFCTPFVDKIVSKAVDTALSH